MYKVERIVTERNTTFAIGFPKYDGQDLPAVTAISFSAGDPGIGVRSAHMVCYSDHTHIEVKDVAEIWYAVMTPEEEQAAMESYAALP
jgi:hypothetical protein